MAEAPPVAADILRLIVEGRFEAALKLGRILTATPERNVDAEYWLSSALMHAGEVQAGALALEDARLLHAVAVMRAMGVDLARIKASAEQAVEVGDALYRIRHVATASVAYGMAVAKGERRRGPLLSYALSLQHQGRAEEAVQVFRAAGELYPDPATQQFLLLAHFYVAKGIERHAVEARLWAARHAVGKPGVLFANPPSTGRKLCIGYVAPSFTQSQIRQFIAPVLESHDAAAFDVFLFPERAETDPAWEGSVHMAPIGTLSDADAAALVRGQGVDVLVDCWGHAAGGRVGVFAHYAAPVQVAWLNYQQTTGLAAMDYVLHADCVEGPGMSQAFTEAIWRVGPTSAPFRPDAPGRTTPAPALRNGHATLGSFNNPAKLSDETVTAWARILKRSPGARLMLKYGYFADPVLCAATMSRFAAHGVDPWRIDFRGHSSGEDYEAAFGEIDLALDPSPVPGGTTSLEALSRGVPVLSLAGATFYARTGLQILTGAGLDDLVARDWDDYVDRAVALAADPAALQALRERTAAGFATANYRDEIGVTRDLERAYRAMFELWETRRAS